MRAAGGEDRMLSCRGSSGGASGSGPSSAGSPQPAAAAQAERSRRRLRIVDAQVHLWKADTPDRPWPPDGVGRAHLPEPFTVDKLLPLMDEAGVDRVVIVPPSWEGDRNDYGLEAAGEHPDRFAVMGRVPLASREAPGLLAGWKEQPGMLGVRLSFLRSHAAWLTDGTADWFWPAAEKAGIPVMVLAVGQAPVLGRIAERHPELTLIV